MRKVILILGIVLCSLFLVNQVATGSSTEQNVVLVAFQGYWYNPSDAIQMRATAYTAGLESTGKTRAHPAYGITYSGTKVKEDHTIAVDPQVVPLGSWVYIEDMGIYRAEDTGGKIKGNRLDIYMPDVEDALEFGIQTVNVHILPKDLWVST